jgi:hypothetical protein
MKEQNRKEERRKISNMDWMPSRTMEIIFVKSSQMEMWK